MPTTPDRPTTPAQPTTHGPPITHGPPTPTAGLQVWQPRPPRWTPPSVPASPILLAAVALLTVVAAGTVSVARPGLQVVAVAAGMIVLTDWAALPPRSGVSRLMLGLALALSAVAMLRDSPWLVALCLLAAAGLTSAAALRARSWSALMLSLPVVGIMWAPAASWLAATARTVRHPRAAVAWARGAGLAAGLAVVFGGLLAWADPVFAVLLAHLTPALDLRELPGQLLIGGLTACLAGALAYAAACQPRWQRQARAPRSRPAAEWALPLAVVDVVLLAFGAVQAAVRFHEYTPSLAAGMSYANRAREGFWQLSAVTLLTLAVLGWAGLRANRTSPRHRLLLAVTGGLLVALTLGVVASALHRMWLYEQEYGWTVLRLCVATFEVWLGAVLLALAAAWALRRTASVPPTVVVSAAVVLLALGLAGPDALVARWNVERFRQNRGIDVEYLSHLSADAVPALSCLQGPPREQVLAEQKLRTDPWYAVNASRQRANAVLRGGDSGRRC